jgi:hypothetical protein
MILFIHAYKPTGGFSCNDIQYPSVPGTLAQDVDLARHNFGGTAKISQIVDRSVVHVGIGNALGIDREGRVTRKIPGPAKKPN